MKKWTVAKTRGYLLAAVMGTAVVGMGVPVAGWSDQSITGIRVAPTTSGTRVVFDLTGPTPYKVFTLDNPGRVVVDFSDTNYVAGKVGLPIDAAVTNLRSAVQSNNALRMVFDLKETSTIKAFMVPPDGQSGQRLVVDIAQPGAGATHAAANIASSSASSSGASAAGGFGAAHIYGGSTNGSTAAANARSNPAYAAGKAPAASVPVVNRVAISEESSTPSESTPAEADVVAIKALLEQPSRPAAVTASNAANNRAARVSPRAESASATPAVNGVLEPNGKTSTPVTVTPPPVASAKTLDAIAAHDSTREDRSSRQENEREKIVEEKAALATQEAKHEVAGKPEINSKPELTTKLVADGAKNAASSARIDASKVENIESKPEKNNRNESNRNENTVANATRATPPKLPTLVNPGNLRPVIVAIDAGHGGQDPGASGPTGVKEKNITLAIARALREELNQQEGVKAELVRTGDYFIPLASRRDIARSKLKADLFVSIHADAAMQRNARGASVFALSRNGATSSLAAMLADRENQSDLIGGALEDKDNMVASVIADLALEGAMEHSMKVGGKVLRELSSTTMLHKNQIEKAGFAVLKSADFPSILVETGFITNPKEESNLRNGAHQQQLAKAITRGVMSYFVGNPPPGTLLAWKRDKGASTLAFAESGGKVNKQ